MLAPTPMNPISPFHFRQAEPASQVISTLDHGGPRFIDVSQLSDKRMNDYINRKSIKTRYRQIQAFQVETGRDKLDAILARGGKALAIEASAASKAVAIHSLAK